MQFWGAFVDCYVVSGAVAGYCCGEAGEACTLLVLVPVKWIKWVFVLVPAPMTITFIGVGCGIVGVDGIAVVTVGELGLLYRERVRWYDLELNKKRRYALTAVHHLYI